MNDRFDLMLFLRAAKRCFGWITKKNWTLMEVLPTYAQDLGQVPSCGGVKFVEIWQHKDGEVRQRQVY